MTVIKVLILQSFTRFKGGGHGLGAPRSQNEVVKMRRCNYRYGLWNYSKPKLQVYKITLSATM